MTDPTVLDRLLEWACDHGIVKAWGRSRERDADGVMRLIRRWWTVR